MNKKAFMDENFLLNSELGMALYNHCKDLPIIDYHCHLIPKEIAENKCFKNITDLALRGDHYKWRLMRACSVDEKFITGDGTDEEKFYHWCSTIEDCIGSPLYHWTHLEMRRYFDYDGPITAERAADVYAHCNKIIASEEFSAWNIFKKFRVEQIGTTDDPADSLEYHKQMIEHRAKDPSLPIVRPTFRPPLLPDATYLQKLSDVSGQAITDWESLLAAMQQRINFFNDMGCLASDHALDPPVFVEGCPDSVVKKALAGETLTQKDVDIYKTSLIIELGQMYAAKGWVMQLHMGAQRNNNTRMFHKVGADAGFDSMSDAALSQPLAKILDALEMKNALPKTVLYALNPTADDMLSAIIGCFQGGGIPGKIQWGSAWWFNDTKTGMQKHMISLANNGVLARFIGMLTDSRSFMSYPRHEYFRRIMAQLVADYVDNGEFPNDMAKLHQIVEGIAYTNALKYFKD